MKKKKTLFLVNLMIGCSVTRLGDFLKFYGTNNLSKVAQMFDDILGYSESVTFYIQTALAVF